MINTLQTDILKLTVSERLQLIDELWESIAATPEAVPLTDAQMAELDRRLELHEKNPDAGEPWEVVRERLGKKK